MRLTIVFVVTICLAVTTGAVFIATERGTQWITAQITSRMPGLVVTGLSGNVWSGIAATRVAYRSGTVSIVMRELTVDASPWFLVINQLRLQSIGVGKVTIITQEATSAQTKPELPSPPLQLRIIDLQIGSLLVAGKEFNDLAMSIVFDRRGIELSQVKLTNADLLLQGQGKTNLALSAMEATGTWRYGNHRGKFDANGGPTKLQLSHLYEGDVGPVSSRGVVALVDEGLSFNLTHEARVLDHDVQLNTTYDLSEERQLGFTGQVSGIPLSGNSTVTPVDKDWNVTINRLELPGTTATGNLVLTEAGYVDLKVEAIHHDLSEIHLAATGSGSSAWAFGGAVSDWTLDVSVRSPSLSFSEYEVESLSANVRLIAGKLGQGNLNASTMTYLDVSIHDPTIEFMGSADEVIDFQLNAREGKFTGRLNGFPRLNRITVDAGGQWHHREHRFSNKDMIVVDLNPPQWQVNAHCWLIPDRICFHSLGFEDGTVSATGQIHDFSIATYNSVLPARVSDNAVVNGRFEMSYDDNWHASLALNTDNLSVIAPSGALIDLASPKLAMVLGPDSWNVISTASTADLAWDLTASGGALSLSAPFAASLTARLSNLQGLAEFDSRLTDLTGVVDVTANVSGSPDAPSINGTARLQEGAITTDYFSLQDIDTRLDFIDHQWRLSGFAQYGQQGRLSIEGDGTIPGTNFQLNLSGSALNVSAPTWRITTNPNLRLVSEDGRLSYTGDLDIFNASILLDSVPVSVPRPSRDVHVQGRQQTDQEGIPIVGKVNVHIGDDVRFKLMSMDVAIGGELQAELSDTYIDSLHGEIILRSGSLVINDQTLRMEQGRIRYDGAVNNPFVDLLALRDFPTRTDGLTVGLRLLGRVSQLETSLYSKPKMSDARALSFLVLGQDFDNDNIGASKQLLSAALGFGLNRSSGFNKLKRKLSLDELTTSASESELYVTAGKKLTDDLYVRYQYNALSSLGALILRYNLTERWRLEATNDVNPSMDLLYEF